MLPELKRILYATDLAPHGPRVFRHAVALARRHAAQVVLLHVLEPLGPTAAALVRNVVASSTLRTIEAQGYAKTRAEIERRLEAFCNRELGDRSEARNVVSDIRIVVGNPARAILDEAKRIKADLVVMGMHGHSGIERAMLGSVANKVVQRSTTPVLLVPVARER